MIWRFGGQSGAAQAGSGEPDYQAKSRAMSLRALLVRTKPGMLTVEHGGRLYPVHVRRLRQARRYTLRLDAAARQMVMTMPERASLREAQLFAERHGGWIAARMDRLPAPVPFVAGMSVPLRGVPHRIVHRPGRGTVWTEGGGGEALLCVAGEAAHLPRRVRDFLRGEARRDLEAAARRHAARLGVGFKRITVRDQASRWGSCSSDGALSFSWRLILAPPYALDYLAAHEVAHLVEMNHGPRFWRLVGTLSADVAPARRWLAAHGHDLHRFGQQQEEDPALGPPIWMADI